MKTTIKYNLPSSPFPASLYALVWFANTLIRIYWYLDPHGSYHIIRLLLLIKVKIGRALREIYLEFLFSDWLTDWLMVIEDWNVSLRIAPTGGKRRYSHFRVTQSHHSAPPTVRRASCGKHSGAIGARLTGSNCCNNKYSQTHFYDMFLNVDKTLTSSSPSFQMWTWRRITNPDGGIF